MGNSSSVVRQHLYVLKVTNMDLPLCPFIHTIIGFNGTPVLDTDPRIFHDILSREDLVFEVMDIRDNTVFTVCMPKGATKLGINVIKLTANITPLNVRITNVREGSPFLIGDQILGIENVYLPDENQLVAHIKSKINSRVAFILMREGHVIAEEIDVKDDMGCEIGMGILYKPHTRECYMRGYNGRIARISEDRVNKQCQEGAHEGGRGGVSSGGRLGTAKAKCHDTSVKAEPAGNDATALSNSACAPPQATVESKRQVCAGESPASTVVGNSARGHLSHLDITSGGSQAEHSMGGADVQDGARPPSTSNDVAPSNRVCDEAGQAHEAEYVRGERKPMPEGAVIINDTLADKNDFIRDDGHLRMKGDAFERRREAFPAEAVTPQHVEEERGVSLSGTGLMTATNDDIGEAPSEKSQISIFENDSDDAGLPFENREPDENLSMPEMSVNGGFVSAKPHDDTQSHLSPLDDGDAGSLSPENGSALDGDACRLDAERPVLKRLSSLPGISAIINDDCDVAYDEWDRVSHAKSEPAPVESRISPSTYDSESMLSRSEGRETAINAIVLPVIFDDVPSGVYFGNDPRAASNPVLEDMDPLERSPDPREPTSDTEMQF